MEDTNSTTTPSITMCTTPKIMTIDICKNCQRYTKENIEGAQMFKVKKNSFGWECGERIHIEQGNLFV